MDVKTVCLGMLTDGEATGYDLKKQFESSFAHFFAAGYGSIYPALSQLAEEGMVACREISQEGKPDRKVYRITPAGRKHLVASLDDPAPSHKVRSDFLATLCFSHLLTEEQVKTVIASRLEELDAYMALFREYEDGDMQDWRAGERFVCGCGKAVMKAMRKYIHDNAGMLLDGTAARDLEKCS